MSILSITLSLSVMLTLLYESKQLHEATVCRQEAWRSGTILLTQNLLHKPRSSDQIINLACRTRVVKSQRKVKWQRGLVSKMNSFELHLKGAL